jgi:uncharacterized protein (TIGR03437 family)
MVKNIHSLCVLCLFVMAASVLQAQTVFVTPGPNSSTGTVFAYSATNLASITSYTAGNQSFLVVGKGDGSKFYTIANSTVQSVTVSNSSLSAANAIANFPQAPTAAVVTPDGRRLAVAAGTLHVFDTSTDTELISGGISVGSGFNIYDVTVSLDGTRYFTLATNPSGGSQLNAISVASNTVVGTLAILGTAAGVAVGPNDLVYVTTLNQFLEIRPDTLSATPNGTIALNAKPGKPAFSPDGVYALVVNQTPATGSAALLISLVNHSVANFVPPLGFPLDSVQTLGTNLFLAYSAQNRSLLQITVQSNGSVTPAGVVVPGPPNSVSAFALSNELPTGTRTTAQYAFVVNAGTVYELDVPNGGIAGQAVLPSGAGGAVSFVGLSSLNVQPTALLAYGNNQVVSAGQTSLPLVVQALDANGRPLSGVPVTFSTTSSGTLSTTAATTAANGYAVTFFTAPQTGPATVTATAGGQTVNFTINIGGVSGGGGTAGVIKILTGQGIMLPEVTNTNTGVAPPLAVLVTDANGSPVSGAQVTFTVTNGVGNLGTAFQGGTSITVSTDANGKASVDFSTGSLLGSGSTLAGYAQTSVTANAPGTNTVTFFITTVPGLGSSILGPNVQVVGLVTGDTLTGPAGTVVGSFRVAASSGTGTPIPNLGVVLSNGGQDPTLVPSASCKDPSGTGALALTDGTGVLVCDVVLGGKTGTGTVTVVVGGTLTLAQFNIRVTPGAPGIVKIIQGNNQTGNSGQTLPLALRVQVTDAFGNLLPGTPVTWQVLTTGGATLSNVSSATDASGSASALATLGSVAGQVQVKVTAGTASATFTLTTNIPAAGIQKVSGDTQTALINTAFAAPLVVKVVNSAGAPVNSAPVTFAVTSGSATIATPSRSTDASGQASTTVTAGGTAGNITIIASTGSLSTTFVLTARLPGPTNVTFVNGASFQPGISPGAIVIISGTGIAPGVQGLVAAFSIIGPLPTSLAGITITFNGVLAPIYYVSNVAGKEQVAVQVPFEVTVGTATVVINSAGGGSGTFTVQVQPLAPGIFEALYGNTKLAVALRPDGSYVSPTNPALRGEVIRIFLTGMGQTNPATGTNKAGVPGETVAAPVVVGLNNAGIPLTSAEALPGIVGVVVVAFQVPLDTQTGSLQPIGLIVFDSANNAYFAQSTYIPIQ